MTDLNTKATEGACGLAPSLDDVVRSRPSWATERENVLKMTEQAKVFAAPD